MGKYSPDFPPPASLIRRRKPFSYFFVTDRTYVVQENIIKMYCVLYQKGPIERLFNYRLSRTRRVVKNVFGNISSYSRVLRKTLLLQPEQLDLLYYVYNDVRRSTHSANFIHQFVHLIMRLMVLESRETGWTWTGELGVHYFPSKHTI